MGQFPGVRSWRLTKSGYIVYRIAMPQRSSAVYVEITSLEHGHGGAGWSLGDCLWSPVRNRSGADRYALMRDVAAGDRVLHFVYKRWADGGLETRYCAESTAVGRAEERQDEPPSPGSWANMAPYYRIRLTDHVTLDRPVSMSTIIDVHGQDIRNDIDENRPRHYPFVLYKGAVRTGQGLYLARCSVALYSILKRAVDIERAAEPGLATEVRSEFVESRRLAAERYFFARNPRLVEEAKRRHGYRCQVCGFDFESVYGERGKGYIEVHHIDPLSERWETTWTADLTTKVEDVAVLCANCHRMAHRTRPALGLSHLAAMVRR
jgi:hypothetical protein